MSSSVDDKVKVDVIPEDTKPASSDDTTAGSDPHQAGAGDGNADKTDADIQQLQITDESNEEAHRDDFSSEQVMQCPIQQIS